MDLAEDETDLVEFIVGGSGSLAIATRWPGWVIPADEAQNIARPLSRIIARHAAIAESVRIVADPIALIVACIAIVLPRIIGYRAAVAAAQKQQPPGDAGVPREAAAPPPPVDPSMAKAAPNGKTAVNFAERLIRDNQGLA